MALGVTSRRRALRLGRAYPRTVEGPRAGQARRGGGISDARTPGDPWHIEIGPLVDRVGIASSLVFLYVRSKEDTECRSASTQTSPPCPPNGPPGHPTRDLATRLQRLSSGLRINRAADDAASLTISEGLRAQSVGLSQGVRNAEQAINATRASEGALNQVNGILGRMRQLSLQGSSSTLTQGNRAALQTEFTQLAAEVDRLTRSGAPAGEQSFQVGATNADGDRVEISMSDLSASGPNLNLGSASVASTDGARQAVSSVDRAITLVTNQRGDIGAVQNRLAFSTRASEVAIENVQASESALRAADIAGEATALARDRLLNQMSISVQRQANQLPGTLLALLG